MSDAKEPTPQDGAGRTILAGSAVVFGAQMLNTLLMLLAQRAILSTLPKGSNGEFYWAQRLVDLVMVVFVELGMAQVAGRLVIHEPHRTDDIMGTFIKLRIFLWIGVSGFTLLGLLFYKPTVFDLTFLTLLYYFMAGRTGVMRMVFETRRRSRTDLTLISALSVLDMILFTIMVVIDQPNLTPVRVTMWMMVSSIPGFIWIIIVSGDAKHILRRFDFGIAKKFMIECAPIFASSILLQLSEKSEIFFFETFSTDVEMGIYGAASKVYLPFLVIIVAFTVGLYASIARYKQEDPERAYRLIFRGLKVLLLLAVCLSMLCTAAAPWFIELLSDGRYADNLLHFQLFPWVSFSVFIVHYGLFMHITIGTQKRNNWIAVALFAGSVVSHLIFTAQLEALGAIVARITSNWLAAVVTIITLREVFTRERVFNLVFRLGGLLLLAAAATWFGVQNVSTLAAVLLALPIFVVFVVLSRAVDSSDLELARTILQSALQKMGLKGGRD